MSIQSCVPIRSEWEIVAARQAGRKIAKEIGFGNVDQARNYDGNFRIGSKHILIC